MRPVDVKKRGQHPVKLWLVREYIRQHCNLSHTWHWHKLQCTYCMLPIKYYTTLSRIKTSSVEYETALHNIQPRCKDNQLLTRIQEHCYVDRLIEQGLTSHQTHYRSYRGWFLQVIWPNQQCQSPEGDQLVLQIRLESHQDHSTMLQ